MKKSEIVKRIEAIEKHVGIAKEQQLEVGKWYWIDRHECEEKALIFFNGFGDTFGFSHTGIWCNFDYSADESILTYKCTEATSQEIADALVKEANRRGYKEGTKIKSFVIGTSVLSRKFHIYRKNVLMIGDCIVFDNGKWAEIIEQPVDKFAELKEAHRNGAVIQTKCGNEWRDCTPVWASHTKYRIKPEEKLIDLVFGEWYEIENGLSGVCLLQYNGDNPCSGWWNGTYRDYFWSFSRNDLYHKNAKPASKETLISMGIKPRKNTKVGDLVKAWCKNENQYVVGYLNDINIETANKYGVRIIGVSDIHNTIYYENARNLTKQEAIELLFGKECQGE